jgi:hypothetical protein
MRPERCDGDGFLFTEPLWIIPATREGAALLRAAETARLDGDLWNPATPRGARRSPT